MIGELIAAISFLTRLPAGSRAFDAQAVARSARWFPLVGLLLGGIYAGAMWVLVRVFSAFVAATLVIGLDAWITGALHLDGLADTADGFGGGRTREDVLRIMRDHAIGSYGAVALVVAMVLKIGCIAALGGSRAGLTALLLAPALGRWSAVLLSAGFGYARPKEDDAPRSVGSPTRQIGRVELVVATVTVAVACVLGRWAGLAAWGLVAGADLGWGRRCKRRIGGVTGDTLGAGVEMTECLVLMVFTGWLG